MTDQADPHKSAGSGNDWRDLGPIAENSARPLRQVHLGKTALAVCHVDGKFSVISGTCNHAGGPLGEGRLDGEYVVCPWHNWKFHRRTGVGEPGSEDDCVPAYQSKVEAGHLWVDLASATPRRRKPHAPHPLARKPERAPGPVRIAGISTTAMDLQNPRFSGSDHLLDIALEHARGAGCETSLLRLADLKFRACEGYYSKSARACTWPCSITQMDPADEMERVYEAFVHWADVVLVATPIRWGSASSLYYRMVERLNCVQNQTTTHNRVLLRDKVASFIIVGGQDNVQAVAGSMLGFFAELGFLFPQFPYVAHSRGWSAEDMENNVVAVRESTKLADGTRSLIDRAVALSHRLQAAEEHSAERIARGGRKAHRLEIIDEGRGQRG